jgi:hypothetical protein
MRNESDYVLYSCIRERVFPRRREILEAHKRQLIQWVLERENVWKDLVRCEIVEQSTGSGVAGEEWRQFARIYSYVLEDLRENTPWRMA